MSGSATDRAPLTVGTMTVGYTDRYVYLGGHFTDDGQINSAIKLHAADGVKHSHKYALFVSSNPSMPYRLKKTGSGLCTNISHVFQL